ncbi:MAG: hypothetical protein H8E42_03150 [Nitrospinae bacterium]|nr:hypothetical protein [Nitrospinota bacterium]MBL7019337.1 hypothetical protein [Nitrospinaceae bacterium]
MASQTIDILCSQCGAFILRYQKKGSGQLIRLYLDRVIEPNPLAQLKSVSSKSDLPALTCKDCGNRIGLAHEGRTYRMIKGSFRRRAVK